jgi:hypothetical protein
MRCRGIALKPHHQKAGEDLPFLSLLPFCRISSVRGELNAGFRSLARIDIEVFCTNRIGLVRSRGADVAPNK